MATEAGLGADNWEKTSAFYWSQRTNFGKLREKHGKINKTSWMTNTCITPASWWTLGNMQFLSDQIQVRPHQRNRKRKKERKRETPSMSSEEETPHEGDLSPLRATTSQITTTTLSLWICVNTWRHTGHHHENPGNWGQFYGETFGRKCTHKRNAWNTVVLDTRLKHTGKRPCREVTTPTFTAATGYPCPNSSNCSCTYLETTK